MADPEKGQMKSDGWRACVGEWKVLSVSPDPSLLGRRLKLCVEQEGKGTPLHVSRQLKDHKPREGEGATQGACSPTGG